MVRKSSNQTSRLLRLAAEVLEATVYGNGATVEKKETTAADLRRLARSFELAYSMSDGCCKRWFRQVNGERVKGT